MILVVHLILGVVSLTSAEYSIIDNETGKYRWKLESHNQYMVCCYCPLKAVMNEEYNNAFQIEDCCKIESEKDQNGSDLYPYCSCEPKMGLTPQFIGCKLPKTKNITWECNNPHAFPNVSVYTICQPSCTEFGAVLHGDKPYRCGEDKQWDDSPEPVYCRPLGAENGADSQQNLKIIIVIIGSALPGILIFMIIIICWRRKWYLLCVKAKSGTSSISNSTELTDVSSNQKKSENTETTSCFSNPECHQSSEINSVRTGEQRDSSENNQEEKEPLLIPPSEEIKEEDNRSEINENRSPVNVDGVWSDQEKVHDLPVIVNVLPHKELVSNESPVKEQCSPVIVKNGLPEYRDGKIYYNVVLGTDVFIITNIKINKNSDFTVDRNCAVQDQPFWFKIKNVQMEHAGVYNWSVNNNNEIKRGSFYLYVNDSKRPDPVGENISSFHSLNIDSIITIEEPILEVSGPGHSPNQNKAVICQSEGQSLPESSSSFLVEMSAVEHFTEEKPGISKEQIQKICTECKRCSMSLSEALHNYKASTPLYNICTKLDPETKNTNLCWIGLITFYRQELGVEVYHILNIKYHKKGNPEDGHMKYILHTLLPPHGFTVGHIVYYFSQRDSRRDDVLTEINKFHSGCHFCDQYLFSKCSTYEL